MTGENLVGRRDGQHWGKEAWDKHVDCDTIRTRNQEVLDSRDILRIRGLECSGIP